MHLFFLLPFLSLITSTLMVRPEPATEQEETTWDPWAPCEEDKDCPESLLCNIWQHRCTECMENEDCPPCLEGDCPMQGDGVCVYGTIAALHSFAEQNILQHHYENCGEMLVSYQ